jgi:tRNA(Ser,Leu) C12 N-acetylase TAN1
VTTRPVPATPTWNVLVTSHEGQREYLLRGLRALARFRRGGFPNVLVATVDDPRAFLGPLADAVERDPAVRAGLAKAVPIDRTFRFADPATFADDATAALEPFVERLAGRTFYVRIRRRGFRGTFDTTRLEGEIGARLVARLEALGAPQVRFADPDVVVLFETLRDEAGVALLDRDLRMAHPFVRVR